MKKLALGVVAALITFGVLTNTGAQALTATEYQSLRQIWKLGYVVGIAHGRKLYRNRGADPREAAMDACIPNMSDVEIVDVVAAYLAANPAAADRPAAEAVLDAVADHCMK